MEEIKRMINLLIEGYSNDEIIDRFGIVFKIIDDTYILEPFSKEIMRIDVSIKKDKIRDVFFELEKPIPFIEISKSFPYNFSCLYNYYDEETFINIYYNEKLTIRIMKEVYIEEINIENHSFCKFLLSM